MLEYTGQSVQLGQNEEKNKKRIMIEEKITPSHGQQAAMMGMTFVLLNVWFLISLVSPKAALSIDEGFRFVSIPSPKYLASSFDYLFIHSNSVRK